MNSSQVTATPEMTQEQMNAMVQAVIAGATISDAVNMTSEIMEGLYALAYNQYTAGNYRDAATLFQALCVYKHTDYRFWIGLGGCRQAQEDFAGAIDAYSMAGVSSALSTPEPFLFAATCYLRLGDRENAVNTIKGLLTMGNDSPEHVACRNRAQRLLELLEAGQN